MGCLDLLAVQGTLKSLLQHYNSKTSILWLDANDENAEMQMMVTVPNLALKKYSFLLFPLPVKNFGFDFFFLFISCVTLRRK